MLLMNKFFKKKVLRSENFPEVNNQMANFDLINRDFKELFTLSDNKAIKAHFKP